MFKNNIKIAVTGLLVALIVALSLAPAELCAMHYLENAGSPSSSITKPSWSFSKSRIPAFVGRSFDKSKFFVRNHPLLTFGALGLVSLGVVGYYSGLFSGSDDKTEKAKKEQVPSCKKGEDVTNQWKIKLAILYSLQAVTAFGSNVFTELAQVFYKMAGPAEKKVEKEELKQVKKPKKKTEEKIVKKDVEQTPDEKAKADLKQLIEEYAPQEEPKLEMHEKSNHYNDPDYEGSNDPKNYWKAFKPRDSEENYIKYILVNLKKYGSNKEQLKSFVNQKQWTIDKARDLDSLPFPTDKEKSGESSDFSLFTTLFLYGYFDALNLLLSTEQLDFTGTYGPYDSSCEYCRPKDATLSSLGRYLFLQSVRKHPENKGADDNVIINVLCSHGAEPLFVNNSKNKFKDKFKGKAEKWWSWSLEPKSFNPTKDKNLYFSSDGTSAITASEFVEQLKKRLA